MIHLKEIREALSEHQVKLTKYDICLYALREMWMAEAVTNCLYNAIKNKLDKAHKEGKL